MRTKERKIVGWTVAIIESERGWGQKVDEVKEFKTFRKAEKFVTKFNAKNTEEKVPDWYMYAQDPVPKYEQAN